MRVMRLKETHPTAKVELSGAPTSSARGYPGLKPIVVRRVWSPVGQRPPVKVLQNATSGPTSRPSRAPQAGRSTGSCYPP